MLYSFHVDACIGLSAKNRFFAPQIFAFAGFAANFAYEIDKNINK